MLAQLEQMLKRSIGNLDLQQDTNSDGDAHRRKRRRKDGAAEPAAAEAMPFRLVSRTIAPKAIQLREKTPPPIKVKEPPCEDDANEAKIRRQQAQAVAVDMDWLLSESRRPHLSHKPDNNIVHIDATLPLPEAGVMIVERPKPAIKPLRRVARAPSAQARPSPHELKYETIHCPIVNSKPSETTSRKVKKRRKASHPTPPRPPAMFWRPLRGWGPKVTGYAMGYEGSWAVFEDDPQRYHYQRDTMRKGILLQ